MRGLNTTVQLLLENGADINLRINEGFTPLYVACHHGHISTVKLLIENGADINLCNEQGLSPLHNVCNHGRESILQYLIRNGANINLLSKEGYSPLDLACKEGHISTVELLIENGADINLCTEYGISPLHSACYHGRESISRYLIKKGANINLLSKEGYSPLDLALFTIEEIVDEEISFLESSCERLRKEIERYSTPLERRAQARDSCIATWLMRSGTRVIQLMIQWYCREMSKVETLLKEYPMNMLQCDQREPKTEMAEAKRNLRMRCIITAYGMMNIQLW
ncbi:serine/threonine-protein phosphatase 6 regulatory ankyrin repeat subunit C-like [Magallana gigas]|uniref:serine/threonine-protein phosphatase 6 regulatory ankyrin repeat subunit C-like n=1 Tax=Magallana gigas TaxID=29159 RepID=UPI003340ACF4